MTGMHLIKIKNNGVKNGATIGLVEYMLPRIHSIDKVTSATISATASQLPNDPHVLVQLKPSTVVCAKNLQIDTATTTHSRGTSIPSSMPEAVPRCEGTQGVDMHMNDNE